MGNAPTPHLHYPQSPFHRLPRFLPTKKKEKMNNKKRWDSDVVPYMRFKKRMSASIVSVSVSETIALSMYLYTFYR